MKDQGVVIVGGGLASQRCAETLRRRGYDGRIRMVCGEPERPYDRPPLSKEHLAGELADEEVAFRRPDWYEDNRVELIAGPARHEARPQAPPARARRRHELFLRAAGDRDRRRPPAGCPPSRASRTSTTCARWPMSARLRDELREGARLAIVGAGFIGQEVAATARGAGAEVTIIEALPAPLTGVLGEEVGRWLMKMHDEEGVEVRLSTKLEGARGNGSVEELVARPAASGSTATRSSSASASPPTPTG